MQYVQADGMLTNVEMCLSTACVFSFISHENVCEGSPFIQVMVCLVVISHIHLQW